MGTNQDSLAISQALEDYYFKVSKSYQFENSEMPPSSA